MFIPPSSLTPKFSGIEGALHLNQPESFGDGRRNYISVRVINDARGNDLDRFESMVDVRDTYRTPGAGDPLFPDPAQQPTYDNPVEVGFISINFAKDGKITYSKTVKVDKPTHGYEGHQIEINGQQAGLIQDLLNAIPIWIRTHPRYTFEEKLPATAAEPYLRDLNKYITA